MKRFLERPENVAFWVMMSLCFVLLTYSWAVTQGIDYVLLFLLIIVGIIFRSAWVVFAWRRPLSVVEKVERVAFWTMILLSIGLLALEYLTTTLFNYYLFYILIAGLLAYYVVRLYE